MNIKIISIGEKGVGKSELISSIDGISEEQWVGTTGFAFQVKPVVAFRKECILQFWTWVNPDVPRTLYFKGASAIILMFDFAKQKSLDRLKEILDEALDVSGRNSLPVLVIGNERDEHVITDDDVSNLLRSLKESNVTSLRYIGVSTNTSKNAELLIPILLPEVLNYPKMCYNCFKHYDQVYFKSGYYFCVDCFQNPDIEKAQAFHRINQ